MPTSGLAGNARADRLHFRELAALAEDLEERAGVALGAAELPDLVKDDAPGDGGEEEQDEQDALREPVGVRDELERNRLRRAQTPARPLRLEARGRSSQACANEASGVAMR